MSDTDATPFRRPTRQGRTPSGDEAPGFPWVQLVFCVACLGIAGWTWMRETRTAFTTEIMEHTEEDVRHDPMFSVTSVPSVVR